MKIVGPGKKIHSRRATAVRQRGDFQPSTRAPEDAGSRHKRVDHDTRIDKYRDRIFGLLAECHLPQDLFDRLDQQSVRDLEGRSENSQVALMSDFVGYLDHILAISKENTLYLEPFPVSDRTLELYLDGLIDQGYKYTTVSRHMNTLRTWHKWIGLPDPTDTEMIRPRLRRIRNSMAGAVSQKRPLQMEHLVRAVDLHNESVLRDVADLALLYTGFETGCRRSELVGFDWSDLTIESDGSGLLFLANSKTDQRREGAHLYLSQVTVAMLDYWQVKCGRHDGKIFRGIYSDGTLASALSTQGVAKAFKRIARKLGLSEFEFAGHSTRIGGAVEQMEQGVELGLIMQSGRWKSPAMVMRYTAQTRAKYAGMATLTRNNTEWTPEKILKKSGVGTRLDEGSEPVLLGSDADSICEPIGDDNPTLS